MAKVIVCCADSSPQALGAARFAGALAGGLGARVVLLHVAARTTAPGVSAAPLGQERLAESERQAGAAILAGVCREAGLPQDTELRVELGDVAGRARAVAEETEAMLLVIGSHGRGAVKRALLGSVSRNLAGDAPCPVVVVPPGTGLADA
ncbi:MAG TPA: universal stress protein [Gaiellaceae bacterium]|nr:universal stress protein [Gaiellaceae bacterium]HXV95767.1 universal stress protein [Gaiellaceae bacterium]